ncbi:MAG: glycosyltransferase family 4 protein [Amylibacter sp.]|jgi:mannosyltransferase|tara:strand:+ start:93737 stop:94789 length:1053 start_codon:yes stop_codon:yes gene_type:complete
MTAPKVFVTNFNKNFTGVSATTAAVVALQKDQINIDLVGVKLPNCPEPISSKKAIEMYSKNLKGKGLSIWHVRRNQEMRTAIWVRDILKKPIKIVFTSAAQRRHSLYPRWLISKMDAVIATTIEAASFVENVSAVVPHGVMTQKFMPAQDRSKVWSSLGYGGQFGVACVGRIRPEKGTDIFIETMLEILPHHPKMVALVIGKATRKHYKYKQDLLEKIEAAGLSDRILFVGEIDVTSMPKIMSAISLLIALPRYEGYGITPIEALSCGTPFVGSATGYFRAFSANGKYGIIVDPEDVAGAVRAIKLWLSKNDQLDAFMKEARKYIIDNYSVEQEIIGIHKVYQSLLDKPL